MTDTEHVVALVHGIRTQAVWHEMVRQILVAGSGVEVVRMRYGYFDTFRFLCPWFTRRGPIRRIERELRSIRHRHRTADISIIAHSFGTYAITRVLVEHPDIEIRHLLLCGSIVPRDFRWDQLRGQIRGRTVNDCGTRDLWPIVAQCTTWGYGASGALGFGTAHVLDRFHEFGHSGPFDPDFVRRFWVPMFGNANAEPPEPAASIGSPASWRAALAGVPVRWAIVGLVIALGVIGLQTLAGQRDDSLDAIRTTESVQTVETDAARTGTDPARSQQGAEPPFEAGSPQGGPLPRSKPPGSTTATGPRGTSLPREATQSSTTLLDPTSKFGDCPESETDTPRRVRLRQDDVVIVSQGGGELLRIDATLRETRIASGPYLNEARGVAVGRDGQILVSTRACGRAAVVRVDPYSGTQTPLLIGDGVPSGIAVEPERETVLVGIENPITGSWGRLVRLNIADRTVETVHVFRPTTGAHGLAIHPRSRDIYFVDGPVFRVDAGHLDTARRVEVDGLRNAQALTFTPQGQLYLADYDDGGPVMQVTPGSPIPTAVYPHDQFRTVSGLASSLDGRVLYVATGLMTVLKISLSQPETPIIVWKGKQGGRPFIAVVGPEVN